MNVTVEYGDPRSEASRGLLAQSHALMESLFPSESNHYISIDALCVDNIRFFEARIDGVTLGCAAVKIYDGYGEIKSMFVDPAARGAGLARALLACLEQEARAESLPVLKLETGNLLTDAHKLYASVGFTTTGPFGDYQDDPNSLFMVKALT